MNIGDIAANVGISQRTWDQMDREKSQFDDAAMARKYGLDAMRDEAGMRPEEQGLRRNEIGLRKDQIANRQFLLPKETNVQGRALEAQGAQADATSAVVPGEAAAAVDAQKFAAENRPTVQGIQKKELASAESAATQKATVDIWRTLKSTGPEAALVALNKSGILGSQATNIQRGIHENDDGTKEPVVAVTFADGRPTLYVPEKNLAGAEDIIYSKTLTPGEGSVVKIGPDGKAQLMFQPGKFDHNPETGEIYDARNGPATVAGVAAGAGVSRTASKREKGLQESEKLGLDILMKHYGGRYDGMTWMPDEKNKPTALAAGKLASRYMREADARGESPNPVAYTNRAIEEIERERAGNDVGSDKGGAASKIDAIGKKFGF